MKKDMYDELEDKELHEEMCNEDLDDDDVSGEFVITEEITRIAYLLASLDGKISREKRRFLRFMISEKNGIDLGSKKANKLLLKFAEDAGKLQRLKEIYDLDEFLKAFAYMIKDDCNVIMTRYRKWYALSFWMLMCILDDEQGEISRHALEFLKERALYGTFMDDEEEEAVNCDGRNGSFNLAEKRKKWLKYIEDECIRFKEKRKKILQNNLLGGSLSIIEEFHDFEEELFDVIIEEMA